jgi:beta-glucuronidase
MHHLFPIETETREIKPLDGIWEFLVDADGTGETRGWPTGLPAGETQPMPVPSSYNDLTADPLLRDHVGDVWYQREFHLPAGWAGRELFIRFGSATHHAAVWLNGRPLTTHKGGYLPFAANLGAAARLGELNRLVVKLNNVLDWTTLPPGEVETIPGPGGSKRLRQNYFHDFYNYAGLHRSIVLCALPPRHIEAVAVHTDMHGRLDYTITCNRPGEVRLLLLDEAGRPVATASGTQGTLTLDSSTLWEPLKSYLYTLEITACTGNNVDDVYRLPVGFRSVAVEGKQFLINGKPFHFRGFGWHEDADLRGKGFDAPTTLRDLNLMTWMGANSFRTSHYPYAEETLRLADRLGLVVISECPAVGLFHMRPEPIFCEQRASLQLQQHHLDTVRDLIARDRNHPSIVMWSIGNEPMNNEPAAYDYFAPIAAETRRLDPHRPLTIVDHMEPETNRLLSLSDVVCYNRYHGWYDNCGELDRVEELFLGTLTRLHEAAGGKPVILAEHGVDTIAGSHQIPATIFTEEFQVEWLRRVHQALDRLDFVIGEHVWVFADFATKQAIHRFNGNKKGIFTRQRQPKAAAFYLKERWLPDMEFRIRDGGALAPASGG